MGVVRGSFRAGTLFIGRSTILATSASSLTAFLSLGAGTNSCPHARRRVQPRRGSGHSLHRQVQTPSGLRIISIITEYLRQPFCPRASASSFGADTPFQPFCPRATASTSRLFLLELRPRVSEGTECVRPHMSFSQDLLSVGAGTNSSIRVFARAATFGLRSHHFHVGAFCQGPGALRPESACTPLWQPL